MVLKGFSGFALFPPLGKFYLVFGTFLLALCKPTVASSGLAYFLQHNQEEQLADVLLTPSCRHDISVYLRHLQEGSKWALQMFDSSGKPDSGLLKGGHTFLGFYSECIEALPKGVLPATDGHLHVNPSFTSTYCLSSLRVAPKELKYEEGLIAPLCKDLADEDIGVAICVPSSCTEDDVSELATLVLRELGCNGSTISSTCLTPREHFTQDIPALATASFFVLLAVIVAAASALDYAGMLQYKIYPHFGGESEQPNSITSTNDPQIIRSSKNRAKSVMLCFSLLQNVSKVFPKEKLNGASINALNGLRFFSILWVICSHSRYYGQTTLLFRNSDDLTKSDAITMAIDRSTLAADTFLVIGGFLVAYMNLKSLRKANGKKNWLLFYVHRYFRTIPLMMAVVVICAFLMRHFRDGPLWMKYVGPYERSCQTNWWNIIIYLQNFLAEKNKCLPQCWYSAVDFQLYLFSPPFLYLLYRWPRVGVSICSICLVGAIVLLATVNALMHVSSVSGSTNYMKHVYMKPYFRMAPYLIGILVGHYTSHDIKRPTLKKRYQNLIWLLCVLGLLFGVFGLSAINPPAGSVWFGLVHTALEIAWCLGIGWIVYASMAGLDGFLINFLSADIFGPLSKLVFAVYVVHQPILVVFYASREESFDYDYYLMGYFFAGGLLLSFAVSTILCLFLEMPVYGLERLIFPRQ